VRDQPPTRFERKLSPSACGPRRSAALHSLWRARAMIFFARSFLSLLASSARLRVLHTSSSAVDIAWMSCGPNTLPSRNGRMVMVRPRVQAGTTKGHFRVPKRPRPLLAGDDLSLRRLGHLANLNSVRIRTELTIELSSAYVRAIIDTEAPSPQASVAERLGAPA